MRKLAVPVGRCAGWGDYSSCIGGGFRWEVRTKVNLNLIFFNNTCELLSLELRKSASILSNLKNTAKRIFAFKNRLRYSRERALQKLSKLDTFAENYPPNPTHPPIPPPPWGK